MRYHVSIRRHADGTYGYAITDGHGTKWAGMRGCATYGRAVDRATVRTRELLAADRRAWVETAPPALIDALASR